MSAKCERTLLINRLIGRKGSIMLDIPEYKQKGNAASTRKSKTNTFNDAFRLALIVADRSETLERMDKNSRRTTSAQYSLVQYSKQPPALSGHKHGLVLGAANTRRPQHRRQIRTHGGREYVIKTLRNRYSSSQRATDRYKSSIV